MEKKYKILKNLFFVFSLLSIIIFFYSMEEELVNDININNVIVLFSFLSMSINYILHIIFKTLYKKVDYNAIEDKDKYITKNIITDIIITSLVFLSYIVRLLLYIYDYYINNNTLVDFFAHISSFSLLFYYYYISFIPLKIIMYSNYFSNNNKRKKVLYIVLGIIFVLLFLFCQGFNIIMRKVEKYG